MPDVDPLDLLVHLAWSRPLITRRERARAARAKEAEFFEHFAPQARAVLDALLGKYAEHGIGQLDDLKVLELPPLDEHGSVLEIAASFGDAASLHAAIDRLDRILYAA